MNDYILENKFKAFSGQVLNSDSNSPIFNNYFENVPNIFLFFLNFWSRTAILYKWWIFHNDKFFPHIFYPFQNISLAAFDILCMDTFEAYGTFFKGTYVVANILTGFKFKTWPIIWIPVRLIFVGITEFNSISHQLTFNKERCQQFATSI